MLDVHARSRLLSRQNPPVCGESPHQLHARALEFEVHGEHVLELVHGCAPALANVASSNTAESSGAGCARANG